MQNSGLRFPFPEKSACGVGFIASRNNTYAHSHLVSGLHALKCVEHRGACAADGLTGDGSGIMTDIPFELFNVQPGSVAVASIFAPKNKEKLRKSLAIFEQTFDFLGLKVLSYRDVPVDTSVLGEQAKQFLPTIIHAIIKRPDHTRTDESFDQLLYQAKQLTRTRESEAGISKEFFFTSLSSKTIVYKALTRTYDLEEFYLDLKNPAYKTRFVVFHRRFSTNTISTWDKVQPFRLIAHNGEINTIAGNRSWAYSREKAVGLRKDELLTDKGISDSGSVNEMAEALRYRSNIPHMEDIMAIMMPPAHMKNDFYKFWSRSMEPWDGPAFMAFSDGNKVGARLDRNGFRPCRWILTDEHFYLSSEVGVFDIDESIITKKGTVGAGNGVQVELNSGRVHFRDPSESRENYDAKLDARLVKVERDSEPKEMVSDEIAPLFWYNQEDFTKILYPMIETGKEAIGSMGDTARIALFSDQPRSLFDYFYQHFAQVTNPPLDYLREEMVTDLSVHLGPKLNIFAKKELIPPAVGIEIDSPILSLGQLEFLRNLKPIEDRVPRVRSKTIDITWNPERGYIGFVSALDKLKDKAIRSVDEGNSVIILSDRSASPENLPIPSLLALRTVVNVLNESGKRLRASLVVDTGEIRSTHHIATLIGFGASAVCPYLALSTAINSTHPKHKDLSAKERENNLLTAFDQGLLKIMAKMGISVARSYQTSKLFTAIGLHATVMDEFFPGVYSPIGGLTLKDLVNRQLMHTRSILESGSTPNLYLFKEHGKGTQGERHAMTISRSRLIHKLVRESNISLDNPELFQEYLKAYQDEDLVPLSIRDVLDFKSSLNSTPDDQLAPRSEILSRFGSGAMSFGAISAESQRDIILAMKEIGGRSNSGEGGENPYYFTDGISASVKQIASGRFGVTAEYLVSGNEIQIKVAQGAKPGEGGQLMSAKVNEDIARARHSMPGIDLISPPPLHDIYSIEDLKQLIYELKQVHPTCRVSVKLVSGANIGTIAVGVAKAGANVIQISGWDGGTGAATLSSMKHAGLPWEIGLTEAHQALCANGLRHKVTLRADGGLHTGRDIVMATILGAEEFDFGKLLLVGQGCMMARVCEKNNCPTGIATHDPKYKAKYKGTKDHLVTLMHYLADDVQKIVKKLGFKALGDLVGNSSVLAHRESMKPIIEALNLDLGLFFDDAHKPISSKSYEAESHNEFNTFIINESKPALEQNSPVSIDVKVESTDRAAVAGLAGEISRMKNLAQKSGKPAPSIGTIWLNINGSAGQGFGAFLCDPIHIRLFGQANDSVAKSMSGGKVVITPVPESRFDPADNAIIGNAALYGATGGKLYIYGRAGDRFAVRNSGATAVVDGIGLHGCEYMTNGTVIVLGATSYNLGAGMTGGRVFLLDPIEARINDKYIKRVEMNQEEEAYLIQELKEYAEATNSVKAKSLLDEWNSNKERFGLFVPNSIADARQVQSEESKTKPELGDVELL